MKGKVVTVKEAKQLGVWWEFCKRQGWDNKRLEEMGIRSDMHFSIDEDLFSKCPCGEVKPDFQPTCVTCHLRDIKYEVVSE